MFQFTGLTSDIIGYLIAKVGCPIRIFTDQRLFAPPRNFSQLITSFIVSESQGIPRTPLLTFFYNYTYRLIVLKTFNLAFVYFSCLLFYSQYVKELLLTSSPGFNWMLSEPDRQTKTLRNSKSNVWISMESNHYFFYAPPHTHSLFVFQYFMNFLLCLFFFILFPLDSSQTF